MYDCYEHGTKYYKNLNCQLCLSGSCVEYAAVQGRCGGKGLPEMADKAGDDMADKPAQGPVEGETGWKTLPWRCLIAAETKAQLFYARVVSKMGQNLGLCIVISGGVLFLVRCPTRSP